MFLRVLLLQVAATCMASLIAGLGLGFRGALSATLGGMASLLPNLFFALRLQRVARRPGASFPLNFFLGELLKLVLTLLILLGYRVFGQQYFDIHWLSVLIGLVLAVQAVFFALWKKS